MVPGLDRLRAARRAAIELYTSLIYDNSGLDFHTDEDELGGSEKSPTESFDTSPKLVTGVAIF